MTAKAKRIFLYIVGVVVIVFLGNFIARQLYILQRSNNGHLERSEYEAYRTLDSKLVSIGRKYLNKSGYVESSDCKELLDEVGEACKKEKLFGSVSSYSIQSDSVSIEMKSGLLYLFRVPLEGMMSGDSNGKTSIKVMEPVYSQWNTTKVRNSVKASADSTFEKPDMKKYVEAKEIGFGFEKYSKFFSFQGDIGLNGISSYHTNWKKDEDVTLQEVKNLSGCPVIIWEGHGGVGKKHGSCLITSEHCDGYFEAKNHEEDIESQRIGITSNWWLIEDGHSTGDFYITSKFVTQYFDKVDGGVVYLGACQSGQDPGLANAFLAKGYDAVYGYTETVDMWFEMKSRAALFGYLLADDAKNRYYGSYSGALAQAQHKIGKNSTTGGLWNQVSAQLKLFTKKSSDEKKTVMDLVKSQDSTTSTTSTTTSKSTTTQATTATSTTSQQELTVRFDNGASPRVAKVNVSDTKGNRWTKIFQKEHDSDPGWYASGGVYDLDEDGEDEVLVNCAFYGSTYGASNVVIYKVKNGKLRIIKSITQDSAYLYGDGYVDCVGGRVENGKLYVTFGKKGGGYEEKQIAVN